MELKLKKSKTETYIVSIYGELDLYNTQKLRELVLKMIEKDVTKIIFDMKETDYIDSTGLGIFIYIFSLAKSNQNLKLCMCNVYGSVKKVIELSRLNYFFTIADSIEDAINIVDN